MISKIFFSFLFFLGLLYLVWPGPGNIDDIPALEQSLKSDEPGDIEKGNEIAAYFSQLQRDQITSYYEKKFSYFNFFGLVLPPLSFNHRVEDAQTSVREQIQSTFLIEYSYPLRDSLFINGYDRVIWNKLRNIPESIENGTIIINENAFKTKTTLRYYPSSVFWRVTIYTLSWVLLILMAKVMYKAWKKS